MRQPAVSAPAGPLGGEGGGVGGLLILLFNDQRLSPDLFPLLSAMAALTRVDVGLCVPGLIAATWLIVFLSSPPIDSPDSGGDSHRHPKTNKPGRTIDNGCKSYRSAPAAD